MRTSPFLVFLALLALPAIALSQEESAKAKVKKRITAATPESATVHVDGGKLIIVDKDGNKKEIEIDGASSITVNQMFERTVKDGQEEEKATGKAIIIGPDGKKQEIELSLPTDKWQFAEPGQFKVLRLHGDQEGDEDEMAIVTEAVGPIGKYYIGVHCEPVSDEQREEMKLGEGVGLVVVEVTDDSPAKEAKLQADDVLLYANDKELTSVEQLIEIIQAAGAEGDEISLTIAREGDEKNISIKPAERKEMPAVLNWAGDEEGLKRLGDLKEKFGVDLDELKKGVLIPHLGPGIIRGGEIDPEAMKEFREQMAEAHAQLAEARDELAKAHAEMRKEMAQAQKEFQAQMKEAHEQLQRSLKELRSKNEKEGDKE